MSDLTGHFARHCAGACPSARRLVVALGGGVDSTVLLHLASDYARASGIELLAAHVNHGLHASADSMADACRQQTQALGVAFELLSVIDPCRSGESVEAWAREQRYARLAAMLEDADVLLTAHHMDDQAETVLLQLMRGAGPAGLSAMPALRRLGHGHHLRPLLSVSRRQIIDAARSRSLSWFDDPSNDDTRFDRNYLRHEVMPRLAGRWPGGVATLARAAAQQAETAGLLDELARLDLVRVADPDNGRLSVTELLRLELPRRRNLTRYWLRDLGATLPDHRRLAQLTGPLLQARADASPEVAWGDFLVRRFRDQLYLLRPRQRQTALSPVVWFTGQRLTVAGGEISSARQRGVGLAPQWKGRALRIAHRRGGEALRVYGMSARRRLKNLMQEAAVPPWERADVPLLFWRDQLTAIAGYWVAPAARASAHEVGWSIEWHAGGAPE